MNIELPPAIGGPADPSAEGEWPELIRALRQTFRIHRAMVGKLLKDELAPPPQICVLLESFANRYIDFADTIGERLCAPRSEVEEGAKPGVGDPPIAV